MNIENQFKSLRNQRKVLWEALEIKVSQESQ